MTDKRRMLYTIIMPNLVEPDDDHWIYLLPVRLASDAPYSTLPCPVAVLLARSENGRLVCVGMRIGVEANKYPPARAHHEINASMLRGVKLGQIVQDLAVRLSAHDIDERAGACTGERPHPGRRGYPDAFYEGIRDLFHEAQMVSPENVYRHIVENAKDAEGRLMYAETDDETLQLSREAVARKWVHTTRHKKHLLGDATPGKAGELRASGGITLGGSAALGVSKKGTP
ncbi:MAG TPA: hypothetical protein VIK32_06220 [Candidatus Limnocylindrales bacterium]